MNGAKYFETGDVKLAPADPCAPRPKIPPPETAAIPTSNWLRGDRVESWLKVAPFQRVKRTSGVTLILNSSTNRKPTPTVAPTSIRLFTCAGVVLLAVVASA